MHEIPNITRINQTRTVFFVCKHISLGANHVFRPVTARRCTDLMCKMTNFPRELKCVTDKDAAELLIFLVTCLDGPARDVDL